jgi:hypothetical protein
VNSGWRSARRSRRGSSGRSGNTSRGRHLQELLVLLRRLVGARKRSRASAVKARGKSRAPSGVGFERSASRSPGSRSHQIVAGRLYHRWRSIRLSPSPGAQIQVAILHPQSSFATLRVERERRARRLVSATVSSGGDHHELTGAELRVLGAGRTRSELPLIWITSSPRSPAKFSATCGCSSGGKLHLRQAFASRRSMKITPPWSAAASFTASRRESQIGRRRSSGADCNGACGTWRARNVAGKPVCGENYLHPHSVPKSPRQERSRDFGACLPSGC